MRSELQGRVALLTGATGGIGHALALGLASEDVTVVAAARQPGLPGNGVARWLTADMLDLEALPGLVDQVTADYGQLDILLPIAGAADVLALGEISLTDWQAALAVNLTAPFLLAQAAAPIMCRRGWGRMLFTSSVAAYVGGYVGPHYAAAKAGLHGLVHALSQQLAPHGVTANALAPALVEGTKMSAGAPAGLPPPPVGRFGRPDEIADVAMTVLRTGYLSGQVLLIDGGLHPT